jgi:DNA repair protein RecO (recombination protein O)
MRLALGWLCETDDLKLVTRFYEIHLLELAGFRPELHQCPGCGNTLLPVDSYFSPSRGGVLCPDCGSGQREAIPLSLKAFKVLRYGQTRDWDKFRRLRLTPAVHAEVENILHQYLVYVLERNLRSVEFLHQLRREAFIE